jgi:hypothetical protein
LKHLLRQHRFSILAALLLSGLLLLTLPMSYAVWREVLGVDAGVDTGNWTPMPTAVVTLPPTASPTVIQPTDISQPTATLVLPTDVPPTELTPTDTPPVEPSPTDGGILSYP